VAGILLAKSWPLAWVLMMNVVTMIEFAYVACNGVLVLGHDPRTANTLRSSFDPREPPQW
jgi:hypothetical protein